MFEHLSLLHNYITLMKKVGLTALGLLSIAATTFFIDRYNTGPLPVADQWGLYTPLLEGSSLWQGFFYQHGSHFLGWSFLASRLLAFVGFSGPLGEGYLVLVLMTVNALLSLQLKQRVTGRLLWIDALLFPLLIYPGLGEIYLWSAHSVVVAFPLLAVLLMAHVLLVKHQAWRYFWLTILSISAIFTGYAFLVSGLILIYFLRELFRETSFLKRKSLILGFIAQSAVVVAALIMYRFPPLESSNATTPISSYLQYFTNLFLNFYRGEIRWRDLFFLCLAWLPLLFLAFRYRFMKWPHYIGIAFYLLGFTTLYAMLNTVSRAPISVDSAFASRYAYFLWPGFLGTYLLAHFIKAPRRWLHLGLGLFLMVPLGLRSLKLPGYLRSVEQYHSQVTAWIDCYQRGEPLENCNQKHQPGPFLPSQYSKAERLLKNWKAYRKRH